ncbi:M28 family peptidase [Jiulongibacter sp. NS-SX5]|uniref:M28 family peptidase n=1 Tax=Jiulongibacter sp. NS-SX5 TaxID=3463854 RepID=UPI004058A726
MKKIALALAVLSAISINSNAQKFKKLPESKIEQSFVEKHIRFLASDALKGRNTGEQGNDAAAAYIAEEFRSYGVMPLGENYFQEVPFVKYAQPEDAFIKSGENVMKVNDDFLVLQGGGISEESLETIRIGYGWISEDGSHNDYENVDVKGKLVITQVGSPETKGFREMMALSAQKEELAKERGAVGMIEIFTIPAPWELLVRTFGDGKLEVKTGEKSDFTRILINSATAKKIGQEPVEIECGKISEEAAPSNNVIGMIKGTDENLKSTFVVLTAHFDHVGFREATSEDDDYIFNGARDNAIGVSGLMTAAKTLAQKPPKRSVLLIAFTGEELGLKGSNYYVQNPLVPLNKTVFNLNIDGAGYNDVTKVSGLGITRTGAEPEISKAVEALGLSLLHDPSPEMNLFDRSDNVRFAAKGIPAPSFSPGFTSFSEDMMKYYHKEADNPETLDFNYCTKFAKSFAYAARLVANKTEAPQWIEGDKYEQAGKELYGK